MAVIQILKVTGDTKSWRESYEERVKVARPRYGGLRVTQPHCHTNITGFTDDTMWIIEVWDSEEDARYWVFEGGAGNVDHFDEMGAPSFKVHFQAPFPSGENVDVVSLIR